MRRGFLSLFTGNTAGKIIGIGREVVLAALFGTSAPVGAFRVANTGTFVAVNFFTADALSVGFLPNYSRLLREDPARAVVYFRVVQRILLILSVLVAIILFAFHDLFASLLAPGLSSPTLSLAADMLTVMAVATPLYVYVNLASFLEIAHGRYAVASTRPMIQSAGLIGGTVFAYLVGDPIHLATGFTASYVLMALWVAIRLRRAPYATNAGFQNPMSSADFRWGGKLLWRTVAPVLWVPIILQGGGVAERAIASTIDVSAVAALDYARLISETIQVLVVAPLGLLMLASLSALSQSAFKSRLTEISHLLLMLCLPASLILWLGSEQIISLVYARGEFGPDSVRVTASILAGLSIGLWAHALSYAFIKALNARSQNKLASLTVAAGAVSMVVADLILVPVMGPTGLGLGASIGALVRLALSALAVKQGGALTRRLCLLSPPIVIGVAIGELTSPSDDLTRALWTTAAALIFVGWTLAIPGPRRDLMRIVRFNRKSGGREA